MLDTLRINSERREKKSFHCSDYGKSALDLFFALKGVTKTNPPAWYDQVKWGAGSGAEVYMLKSLVDAGHVEEFYDQDYDGRVEFTIPSLDGDTIPVTGYMDVLLKNGSPVEIKTINNKNKFDIEKYANGDPRENYVGQLSMYNYFTQKDVGHLFVCSIDGLSRFWFDNKKLSEGIYQCGNTRVDLNKEFERWANIWKVTKEWTNQGDDGKATLVPPEFLWAYRYKYDINTLDWTKVPASKISLARNGHAVIGDWQIQYSDWKDLIVHLQGETLGYTPEELLIINEKTRGYTTWNKK